MQGSSALTAICRLVRNLKPGECVQVDKRELHLIPPARLVGPFGPEWSPVDQIMERIVGSSYEILATENPCDDVVRFCRLCEPTNGDKLTYVSPDRRDRYIYDGTFYRLRPSN